MKTIGEIAYDTFHEGRSIAAFESIAHYERARWDNAAKAVALAIESAERRSSKCEETTPEPKGTGGAWRCLP